MGQESFAEHNNGEPDVVFFVYDPDYYGSKGSKELPYSESYDDAVAIQDQAVREVESRVKEVRGFRMGGPVGLDSLARPAFYETTPTHQGIGQLPNMRRRNAAPIDGSGITSL